VLISVGLPIRINITPLVITKTLRRRWLINVYGESTLQDMAKKSKTLITSQVEHNACHGVLNNIIYVIGGNIGPSAALLKHNFSQNISH